MVGLNYQPYIKLDFQKKKSHAEGFPRLQIHSNPHFWEPAFIVHTLTICYCWPPRSGRASRQTWPFADDAEMRLCHRINATYGANLFPCP